MLCVLFFRMAAPAANNIAEPPSLINSKSCLNHPTKILSRPYSRCLPIKVFNTIAHPPLKKIKVFYQMQPSLQC